MTKTAGLTLSVSCAPYRRAVHRRTPLPDTFRTNDAYQAHCVFGMWPNSLPIRIIYSPMLRLQVLGSEERARKILRDVDSNGDGHISFDEFSEMMKHL